MTDDTRPAHRLAQPDCQVLVVGAGPTGLVLAAELLARGISTRIIDKGDGVALETRALAIHARTLEVLDMMGLADRFLERGQIVHRFRFYSSGRNLLSLDLSRCGSRFGFMLNLAQQQTESLLRARVGELGGTIEQRTELVGLTGRAGSVTAAVQDRTGRASMITAGFVVGCDGAHSRVRRELGLSFRGHPYPQDWLLADVRLDWDRRDDEVHAFFRADPAPLICFPMPGHRWRLVVPYAGDRDRKPPTLPEIQQLVDQRAPEQIAVSDPTWLATFRCHRRSTDVYRRGRVLLAGDAVHVHTPAGGQGMNTGIMDAHNLAWKLALVASGRAPEQLLDSYGQERAPVAAQVLRLTHTLVRLGTMSHPLKRGLRDAIVPAAGHIPAIQRRAARRLTQVHVAYPSSRLTRPHRRPGKPKPGQRAPDIEVLAAQGGTRLHSVLRRGRHVLVVAGADPATALEAAAVQPYRDLLEAVTDGSGHPRGRHDGRRGSVLLVRPDGYIAARGTPGKMAAIAGYLRQLSAESGITADQRPVSVKPTPDGTASRK
jgi:2-polyprenyl-6-methoxyphenol hydroxylase-like FAD-dependent oxidoreductase